MSSSLPAAFLSVNNAKSMTHGFASIIGVVVDALPLAKSGGSSFISTFTVKDCDFAAQSWQGLKIRFFRDQEKLLPTPQVGDVVLLRKIKITSYQSGTMGLSSQRDNTPWAIFQKTSNQRPGFTIVGSPGALEPSSPEKQYALFLLNSGTGVVQPHSETTGLDKVGTPLLSKRQSTPGLKEKFSLIKDAKYGTFINIVGQVVKTYPEDQRFQLYVTDYTQNKELFNYPLDSDNEGRDGDIFNYTFQPKRRRWPGPFGRLTLQITLWEPHAYFARENVKEDDFVLLRNVNIKNARMTGVMEGNLHTDQQYPDKVGVILLSDNEPDERLKQLLRRKTEYWKKIRTENGQLENELNKGQLTDNEIQNKKGKKKRQSQPKKKQAAREADQSEIVTSLHAKKNSLNPHIRAGHPAVPCRSIRDILENESHNNVGPGGVEYRLPFQNLRYRASIRVVDFFPPKLEDFAAPYNPEYALLSDGESDGSSDDSNRRPVMGRWRWEWRFCLLVEDGGPNVRQDARQRKERMKLYVADTDAVFLLRMDAVNLRENPQVLAELREKLFILWGDLEERKSANLEGFNADNGDAVSAKPFTCCIKEYGVKTHPREGKVDHDENSLNSFGWERRFRMFATTIP